MYILRKMLEDYRASQGGVRHPTLPGFSLWRFPVDKIQGCHSAQGQDHQEDSSMKLGVTIVIEDDGRVYVAATDQEAGDRAQKMD